VREGERMMERETERKRERERERERERKRERARERGREGGKERGGEHSACMLMLCSSAGGTHSVFVRAVGVVATFLLLLSSPALSVQTVRLGIELFWASRGVYLNQGTRVGSEPGPL